MPRLPDHYANLLGQKIKEHGTQVYLVNTGWSGGAYGTGERMKLKYTRAMITAALEGKLDGVQYETHDIFGLQMPTTCAEVPAELLNPRNTWADKKAYDEMLKKLSGMFVEAFKPFTDTPAGKELVRHGPQL